MSKDIVITVQYDTFYDVWLNKIIEALDLKGIDYAKSLPQRINKSLQNTVNKFLKDNGYKILSTLEYRKNLVKRLEEKGLYLSIKSNSTLWLFLDYFTDLNDYSKCFDIEFKVIDTQKLMEECHIITNKKEYIPYIKQPIKSKRRKTIDSYIYMLESKIKKTDDHYLSIVLKIIKLILEEYGG